MSKIKKKAVILSIIGFLVGITIGLFISLVTESSEDDYISLPISLFRLFIGGLYGSVSMGASIVYDIEKWSITRATITHFGITLVGFYSMGTIQGWLIFGDTLFLIVTVAFIVTYFIIWLANFLTYKAAVGRMNKILEKTKEKKSSRREI